MEGLPVGGGPFTQVADCFSVFNTGRCRVALMVGLHEDEDSLNDVSCSVGTGYRVQGTGTG